MRTTEPFVHFTLSPKDISLIISGLGELVENGDYTDDDKRAARDLQATFQALTRLWNRWRLTVADPIGGE